MVPSLAGVISVLHKKQAKSELKKIKLQIFPISIFLIDFSNIDHPDPTEYQKIKIGRKTSTAAPEKNRENKTVSVSGFTINSTSGYSSTLSVEESTTRPMKQASSDVPDKTVKGQIIFERNICILNFMKN